MGDDIPPGELNRITKPGQKFGFPWYGGGHVRTVEYKDSEPPADAVSQRSRPSRTRPISAWSSIPASSSLRNTRSGVFTAQHGSWNRTVPDGARVLFTPINADGIGRRSRRCSPKAG